MTTHHPPQSGAGTHQGPAAARAGAVAPDDPDDLVHRRRWLTLGVLCFSLLVTSLDNTILNVALPTLVRELEATNSELQWIVDSYVLVFAGLLLLAGSLGDRFGRKGAFQVGLVIFGISSLVSALAGSPAHLVVTRGIMGLGGAFIMPSTLSILTNVFPAHERPRAIGIWAGVAGIGVALGPILGGFLVEHFGWSWAFLVNVPVVLVGLLGSAWLVPTSRDPARPRQDPVGALLSIVGLIAVLYGFIQAPERGWTDPAILVAFAVGLGFIGLFVWWELRIDYPMLDMHFFLNPRFSAASISVTLVFFSLFGSSFLFTQHLQFVMGYSPVKAGASLIPYAVVMLVVAPMSARIVERWGTKLVVSGGLALIALSLLAYATLQVEDDYPDIIWRMALMAVGMSVSMAPATESIMGALPRAKAGIGSAVNDATRQVGGTLGVAVLGSLMSSVYGTRVADAFGSAGLPAEAVEVARSSLGGALAVGGGVGGAAGEALLRAAREAFVDGLHLGMVVGTAIAVVGVVVAYRYLPARPIPVEAVEAEEADDVTAAALEATAAVPGAPEVTGGAPLALEAD